MQRERERDSCPPNEAWSYFERIRDNTECPPRTPPVIIVMIIRIMLITLILILITRVNIIIIIIIIFVVSTRTIEGLTHAES